jgi:hypothetical protein
VSGTVRGAGRLTTIRSAQRGSARVGALVQYDHDNHYWTGWRETPSASAPTLARGQGRASPQWLLRYCQGARLSAVNESRRRPRNEDVSNWAAPCRHRPVRHRHRAPALHRAPANPADGFANSAASHCGAAPISGRSSAVSGLSKRNRAKYASL